MEVLNLRHEIRATSLDISQAFDTVWHPTLISKLSAYGIQGQLCSWIIDFHYSHIQHGALNGILSFRLPVKAGVPQGSVPDPILVLTFINDLSDSLKNPISLLMIPPSAVSISHPSDRQAAASPFSTDLGQEMVQRLEYVFQP